MNVTKQLTKTDIKTGGQKISLKTGQRTVPCPDVPSLESQKPDAEPSPVRPVRVIRCDLHIHSCLSPCADLLMTPANIIEKALQEGLDLIAITDHNAAGNVEVAIKLAADSNLSILPAMEVESSEEVHLLCYFDKLGKLYQWNEIVAENLPDLKNDEESFGYQLLTDENDEYIAKEERLLATATRLSVNKIVEIVRGLGGIVVPSHLDRPYNSLLANLGFIPEDLHINLFEISRNAKIEQFLSTVPMLKKIPYIVSSDSHYLKDIKVFTEIDINNQSYNGLSLPEEFLELIKNVV